MAEGQSKELNQIELDTVRKRNAWRQQLRQLAKVRQDAEKQYYMSQKGATEVKWANSKRGKMTIDDYVKELLQDPKIAEEFNRVLTAITEKGEREKAEIRRKYTDALIDEYGTVEQRIEKLNREWAKKLSTMPTEYLHNASRDCRIGICGFQNVDQLGERIRRPRKTVVIDLAIQPRQDQGLFRLEQGFDGSNRDQGLSRSDYQDGGGNRLSKPLCRPAQVDQGHRQRQNGVRRRIAGMARRAGWDHDRAAGIQRSSRRRAGPPRAD